jgi:hypothetical protein
VLYAGTYISANCTDTLNSTIHAKPAQAVTPGTSKLIATSAANVGLTLYKDAAFVKIFGVATSQPRPIPPLSMAIFAFRDCMTIAAAFIFPPVVASYIPISREIEQKFMSRANIAQFAVPALMQLVSTPLHLFGLDLYNRPKGGLEKVTFRDRLVAIRKNYLGSTLARMCRIIPAYGIGGVVNRELRLRFMHGL